MAYTLTPVQAKLKRFIQRRIKQTGAAPSFDEMRRSMRVASKATVHRLIKELEGRGHIIYARTPGGYCKRRCLEVLA